MNSQLQAAQSYWTAKRDEAKSNIDLLLTKPVFSTGNPQQEINYWFKEFSDAQTTLTTVNLIIANVNQNQQQTPQPTNTNE